MNELNPGEGIEFEYFAKSVNTASGTLEQTSFIHDLKKYWVEFIGVFSVDLPETVRKQIFEADYLQPIATELGISLSKTAQLIAYRNAWIDLFQKFEISAFSYAEILCHMKGEAFADYIVLTSDSWFKHPWMQDQVNQPDDKEFCFPTNLTMLRNNPDWSFYHQTWEEDKIHDIQYCIDMFLSEDNAFNSWVEVSAHEAEFDVRRAKKRIEELNNEIKDQREIITKAKEPINKLKEHNIKVKKSTPGRPSRQSVRYDISKKFVAQWVNSLMTLLSISSLGELARVLGGDKMKCGQPTIWWRRQKQNTLTSLSSLEDLLDVEIKSGNYKGIKLQDLQTNPNLTDLIDLVKLANLPRSENNQI